MNYLTQYYKNLSEQLQERINNLQEEIRSADQIAQIGDREYRKAVEDLKIQKGVQFLDVKDYENLAQTVLRPYLERSQKRETLLRRAAEELPKVVKAGDVVTGEQFADVMTDVNTPLFSGKVAGLANVSPDMRDEILKSKAHHSEVTRQSRSLGHSTAGPPDIAAMRKVIAMGRGEYTPPSTPSAHPHSSNATY